jgi:hypothetical protein
MNSAASPAQLIISSMLTPAFLILGSGSLVATALQRLARAVDRARAMLQVPDDEVKKSGWTSEDWRRWLARYAERSSLAERAVTVFFVAVGIFVIDCLSIAVDHYFANSLTWLPVSLTIVGMAFMLSGAYYMVLESRLAALQIREEIQARAARPSSGP